MSTLAEIENAAAHDGERFRFLSRDDQGGRPDGVQVLGHKGHAFIGHMFSDGFSVVDVHDPLKPKPVAFIAAPKNTRSHRSSRSPPVRSPSIESTTSTRCSSVLGPAIAPSLVTWPTRKMGMPERLAVSISRTVASRTWLTLPGAEPKGPAAAFGERAHRERDLLQFVTFVKMKAALHGSDG